MTHLAGFQPLGSVDPAHLLTWSRPVGAPGRAQCSCGWSELAANSLVGWYSHYRHLGDVEAAYRRQPVVAAS
ncbi:MAG: hypothetical protein ACRD0J_09730 [Acidimicrobiales bacterium]